jgi:hypothetical protein
MANSPFDVTACDNGCIAGEPFKVTLTFNSNVTNARYYFTNFNDAWLIFDNSARRSKWVMKRRSIGAWSTSGTNTIDVEFIPDETSATASVSGPIPSKTKPKRDGWRSGTGTGTVFGSSAPGSSTYAGVTFPTEVYQCQHQIQFTG